MVGINSFSQLNFSLFINFICKYLYLGNEECEEEKDTENNSEAEVNTDIQNLKIDDNLNTNSDTLNDDDDGEIQVNSEVDAQIDIEPELSGMLKLFLIIDYMKVLFISFKIIE